jgi:Zn-finger nucleic acid-binding protein
VRCPDCPDELVILEVEEVELDVCISGHGSWFDAQELGLLFAAAELPVDLEAELLQVPGVRGKRRCPRCSRAMHEIALAGGGPVLDRCPRGHGLWLDPGELQALAGTQLGSEHPALRRVQDYLRKFFPSEAPTTENKS